MNLLDITIFLPLVVALIILFLKSNRAIKNIALIGMSVTFAVSLILAWNFEVTGVQFQFVQKVAWIPQLGIHYFVGIDGLALLLILLTTFLTPLALLGTWNSIEHRVKIYILMLLILETGMLGVFASLDVFLFYIFWEAMLIPMYFIIGIWGGENRVYAAVKFFLYTLFGSLLMLVALIVMGSTVGAMANKSFTMDLLEWYRFSPLLPFQTQVWLFIAFGISFAIKVPVWPFHTWLPDAHVEAPTAGSVILAGVLLKMGTYGFLRFNLPLFPEASIAFVPMLSLLAVVGIVYGALVAMVQTDIKKLVAYSSVSHLGFVMLGIFSMTEEGIQGAILQMVNHGLSTGALFLLVGMMYDRTHTRIISEYGGYARIVPVYSTLFLIITFSSIGLPGLNGFVGEFLILLGAFTSNIINNRIYAIAAATGVILAAVYMLWMVQRVFFGPLHLKNGAVKDINAREIAVLSCIVLFVVWIGVYPKTFLKIPAQTTTVLVQTVQNVKSGIKNEKIFFGLFQK